MEKVPAEQFPRRDFESLKSFLKYCQQRAIAERHPKIASISLEVQHIDPLAVLQAIYEPDELHFYIERPQADEALAGAEAIVQGTFSGKTRFAQAKAFAEKTLEHVLAVGDCDLPYGGPHFFCGFAFFDEAETDEAPFAPATVFLPRWQVARREGVNTAVANVPITPDADIDFLAKKVWAAHERFSSFHDEGVPHPEPQRPEVCNTQEYGPENGFSEAVEEALKRIAEERYQKIVLARALDIEADCDWQPLECLDELRARFAACYAFSIGNGQKQSFIGATPERLLKVENNTLLTEALAGSAPRGKTAREDAQLAKRLLSSQKDCHEHQLVIDSIIRRLKTLGVEPKTAHRARLVRLQNVQHIHTPIQAELEANTHLLDALAVLHPTPAVGGMPREPACKDIAEIEHFDRGLYAGVVGWFDHTGDGEMSVAIRTALINGKQARVYAGVGIVAGSTPENEMKETQWKLEAMLSVLKASHKKEGA